MIGEYHRYGTCLISKSQQSDSCTVSYSKGRGFRAMEANVASSSSDDTSPRQLLISFQKTRPRPLLKVDPEAD